MSFVVAFCFVLLSFFCVFFVLLFLKAIHGSLFLNPRRACAVRVTVVVSVCLCVCVSVTLNLTCRMFVRLTNDTTYLTGNKGRTVFSEKCSVAKLERFHRCTANASSRHFITVENAHARYMRLRGGKGPFCFSWFSSYYHASKSHFEGYNEPWWYIQMHPTNWQAKDNP